MPVDRDTFVEIMASYPAGVAIVTTLDADGTPRDVGSRLRFGYPTNETGFGWTNAAVLELLEFLGKDVLSA